MQGESRIGWLMMEKLTLSQLEQYLSKAAWILKGPVDASDFKVYIFPLLFFKRISDVYDEEYALALEESSGDKEYAALPEFHRYVDKGHKKGHVVITMVHNNRTLQDNFAVQFKYNSMKLINIVQKKEKIR